MNLKSLRNLSLLGLASITLVACGSKPKSISCDGLNFFGPLSFKADQEKIVLYFSEKASKEDDDGDHKVTFAERSEVSVEDSKIIVNPDKLVEGILGKGPYELSLKTCPTGVTAAVQYFIP